MKWAGDCVCCCLQGGITIIVMCRKLYMGLVRIRSHWVLILISYAYRFVHIIHIHTYGKREIMERDARVYCTYIIPGTNTPITYTHKMIIIMMECSQKWRPRNIEIKLLMQRLKNEASRLADVIYWTSSSSSASLPPPFHYSSSFAASSCFSSSTIN